MIETSFEIAEPVNCDRTRIGQLVSNLIGNALTHGAPDQPVRVGAKTEGGEFQLWFANAGEPIPAAAMEKLFEPFNAKSHEILGAHELAIDTISFWSTRAEANPSRWSLISGR